MMERGFTLLEVLVVLAVVSVLSGVIGTVMVTSITSAEIQASEEGLGGLKEGLLFYFEDTDQFPQSSGNAENDLQDLIADPGATGWDGPYINSGFENNGFVKDAWNRTITYSYTMGTMSCVVRSNGPDGLPGNSDDILLTINATPGYSSKTLRVQNELEVIKYAAQTYATNNGGLYPGDIDDLYSGNYLADESFRMDPWLTEYQTSMNQFVSFGPDRNLGGGDDIYPY